MGQLLDLLLRDKRDELLHLLRARQTKAEYRRLLCLWLRLALSLSAPQIGLVLGISAGTVRSIQSAFHKQGIGIVIGRARGGARHKYLSDDEELHLISKYRKRARSGAPLNVAAIRAEFQRKVGKTVALSTIYRMLARHGCRSLLPRARRTFRER